MSLLLVSLTVLAATPYSHSQSGVLQLFLFSLFVSLGFLLFGGHRFDANQTKPHRSA
ncbi:MULTISPECIES: hypothetical protein [unclassified Pseudomonas]|uniref:hypothetical protein n=1 Tax=unclassified Pseudomonas TaxID=196821 RepID=UPI00244D2DC8|nr:MULTISPECIES: hypothetical protein [unclassified Pseudomonas]MDH0894651.1 hypothetical protein [Pseudomonas sp. GD03875]MDH1067299.1 hypothetical protein [Pseudomonas sp. GD03985]